MWSLKEMGRGKTSTFGTFSDLQIFSGPSLHKNCVLIPKFKGISEILKFVHIVMFGLCSIQTWRWSEFFWINASL